MTRSTLSLQSVIFFPLTRVFLGLRRLRWMAVASHATADGLVAAGLLQVIVRQAEIGEAGYFVPVFGTPLYASTFVADLRAQVRPGRRPGVVVLAFY